jgi:NAD(P)-dependent dehydrogenase (short-subunit alcohol dehydrogenase family)
MNIFGVHLDTRSTLDRAKAVIADIESTGSRAIFFNTNAADERRRRRVLSHITETLQTTEAADAKEDASATTFADIHLMVHTLAFGSLRPYISENPAEAVTEAQLDMTLRVMAHSLVYWTRDLVQNKLLEQGSRIYALTSIGSQRATANYGPVSAAKAALESHARQLALELAPRGIAVNCVMPGVTDTPALHAIPGYETIIEEVLAHHPAGRLTTPQDVAQALVCLADPKLTWITGAVIPVDGGESIIGIG